MRRLLSTVFLLMLLCVHAQAENLCICEQDECLCFIQFGDAGPAVECIQNELVAQGFLAAQADASIYDKNTVRAVMRFQETHLLPPTGMMDDATLTLLLWGMTPEELDMAMPDSISLYVWIPTDSGIRHHKRSTCSNMFDPRLVSQRNALKMDMQPCGRCKPDGLNTILLFPVP